MAPEFVVSDDGTRLAYEIEGTGQPLILHMGGGCDASLWRATGYVDRLAQHHQCVLFDHRGHGLSDRPPGAAANHVDRYSADVIALLDGLGIEAADFWGYSSGGVVGLKVADDHPARIHRLVVSGEIWDPGPEELAVVTPERVRLHRESGWEWLIDGFREEDPGAPRWMDERIRATDVEPYIGWCQARPDWNWRPWEAMARITAPTLFVVGELEDPDDEMAAAVAPMTDGRRVRIPGKGHINAFLASDAVIPIVEPFLADEA